MFRAVVSTLLIIAGGIGQPKMAAPRAPRAASLLSNQQTIELARGKIIENLVCLTDATHSYALYLPARYTPARKWPILYAFDPGARGKIPVERFQEAAEKYGWIVAGSNNSRNGAFQPSVDAWNAIVKDTHDRLAIDDARVYVTGFSGGARLAIYFAARCQDCVAGVIASGAGLPAGTPSAPLPRFAIFMTTGVDDFNFPEVKTLDEELAKVGATHQTKVFAGRHEWPPPSVAMEAVEWMELQAMKSGTRDRDNALIDSIWENRLRQARELEDATKVYFAYQIYLGLSDSFKSFRDVSDIDKKLGQLKDSREVTEAIRDEHQQIRKQREIDSQVRSLIAAQAQRSAKENVGGQEQADGNSRQGREDEGLDPDTRLHGMLAHLREQSSRPEDTGERRVARRVLGGLFIGLIEQGINLLQTQKRYDEAARTFKLATEVNPERAGAFFYLAWAHAANGDKKKSLQALKTAVDKGFTDLAAIADNKAFDSIHNDRQYQQVIEILKHQH
jgi:predicted esterase